MKRIRSASRPWMGALAAAIVVLALHAATRVAAQPAVYFVSPSGNDANPGTDRRPFRTIQQAANVVNPGDTVIVGNGVYTGTAGPSCGGGHAPIVCLRRGGTSQAWVTFRAQTPGGAKIDGRSNTNGTGFRFLEDANYVRIEGFEIFGLGESGQSAAGLELFSGGHDVVIAQNQIHHIGRLCTDVSNGQTGIFVQQPRVAIVRNVLHDIGRFAPGENGCEPKTIYYQNHDHGIYVDGGTLPGASDTVIVNNIFYDIARGWPIQVYPGTVTGLSILNNTFAFENPYSTGHIIIGATVRNGQIVNNLFVDPHVAAITFYAGTYSNLTIANNLSSRAIADRAPAGVSMANNLANTDAKVTPFDFQPAPTSPAIDAGMNLIDVPNDIRGTARPQGGGWDIGATELVVPFELRERMRSLTPRPMGARR